MGHDLDDDELRATRELFTPDKIKINKALNKIYQYESDALLYADEIAFELLKEIERILKGDD